MKRNTEFKVGGARNRLCVLNLEMLFTLNFLLLLFLVPLAY